MPMYDDGLSGEMVKYSKYRTVTARAETMAWATAGEMAMWNKEQHRELLSLSWISILQQLSFLYFPVIARKSSLAIIHHGRERACAQIRPVLLLCKCGFRDLEDQETNNLPILGRHCCCSELTTTLP